MATLGSLSTTLSHILPFEIGSELQRGEYSRSEIMTTEHSCRLQGMSYLVGEHNYQIKNNILRLKN